MGDSFNAFPSVFCSFVIILIVLLGPNEFQIKESLLVPETSSGTLQVTPTPQNAEPTT